MGCGRSRGGDGGGGGGGLLLESCFAYTNNGVGDVETEGGVVCGAEHRSVSARDRIEV